MATVIGQWVSGVYAVLLNHFRNPVVRPSIREFKPDKRIIGEIYRVGLPTIVTQALGSACVYFTQQSASFAK